MEREKEKTWIMPLIIFPLSLIEVITGYIAETIQKNQIISLIGMSFMFAGMLSFILMVLLHRGYNERIEGDDESLGTHLGLNVMSFLIGVLFFGICLLVKNAVYE